MRVWELIQQLSKLDPDAEVAAVVDDDMGAETGQYGVVAIITKPNYVILDATQGEEVPK